MVNYANDLKIRKHGDR